MVCNLKKFLNKKVYSINLLLDYFRSIRIVLFNSLDEVNVFNKPTQFDECENRGGSSNNNKFHFRHILPGKRTIKVYENGILLFEIFVFLKIFDI